MNVLSIIFFRKIKYVIKILFIRKLYVNIGKRVGQMVAAAGVERQQVRKVRASQGRMPDNVWWRRL